MTRRLGSAAAACPLLGAQRVPRFILYSGRYSSVGPEVAALYWLPLHSATIVIAVLMVLHRHRHGLEGNGTIAGLDRLLEIEILDREVVVAIFVGTPHRGEIRLAHGVTHGVLFREVTT